MVETLDLMASDGGPLIGIGDNDGVDIADPTIGTDLGVSTLDLNQVVGGMTAIRMIWMMMTTTTMTTTTTAAAVVVAVVTAYLFVAVLI